MSISGQLEEFDRHGSHGERTHVLDAENIGSVLESLRDAWSATLTIPGTQQQLLVSFSSGNVAVMLVDVGDAFYDLLADPGESGWVTFVHGGQPAEHPRRHCVPLAAAVECAIELLRSGGINVPSERWELQGVHQ